MKTSKYIWEILVPVNFNDGQEVPVDHHKEWDSKVREIANGLTILKSAKGQWISDEGTLFAEKMIPVRIACNGSEIRLIANITLEHYKQIKVMYYRIADEVTIYP